MRFRRPFWIALAIVLGLPAGIAAVLTIAPTVGPWIVSVGAIALVAWAIKRGGETDGDSSSSTSLGWSDSSSSDSGGGGDSGGGSDSS
jgi:uncharacterized membrane protein YgcG